VSDSVILRTAARALVPLLAVISVFVLLRGHNEPGGGFIGGLLAAAGVALYQLAFGVAAARRLLPADPRLLIGSGLLAALAAGAVGVLSGRPFLAGRWFADANPGVGKIGTPLLFDVGVWLVVIGTTALILFTLGEEAES